MKALLSTIAIVAACSVAFVGCSDRDRDFVAAGATSPANGTGSNTGGAGANNTNNPGNPPTPGVVGQLTGDPDDEVAPQLQDLVGQALALDATDEPLEGF